MVKQASHLEAVAFQMHTAIEWVTGRIVCVHRMWCTPNVIHTKVIGRIYVHTEYDRVCAGWFSSARCIVYTLPWTSKCVWLWPTLNVKLTPPRAHHRRTAWGWWVLSDCLTALHCAFCFTIVSFWLPCCATLCVFALRCFLSDSTMFSFWLPCCATLRVLLYDVFFLTALLRSIARFA